VATSELVTLIKLQWWIWCLPFWVNIISIALAETTIFSQLFVIYRPLRLVSKSWFLCFACRSQLIFSCVVRTIWLHRKIGSRNAVTQRLRDCILCCSSFFFNATQYVYGCKGRGLYLVCCSLVQCPSVYRCLHMQNSVCVTVGHPSVCPTVCPVDWHQQRRPASLLLIALGQEIGHIDR